MKSLCSSINLFSFHIFSYVFLAHLFQTLNINCQICKVFCTAKALHGAPYSLPQINWQKNRCSRSCAVTVSTVTHYVLGEVIKQGIGPFPPLQMKPVGLSSLLASSLGRGKSYRYKDHFYR